MEYIGFDKDKFQSFRSLEDNRPLHMLNLVQLKKQVTYPNCELVTGKEANQRYGDESEIIFIKLGGSILWRG